MALLIVDLDKHIGNAKAWRDTFAEQLPDLEIRIWPDARKLADIEYLAFMPPDFDALPIFPNLKAMFSRSVGVLCRAARRRSDDDGVRRYACSSISSRYARVSGRSGQSGVAPHDDCTARAKACRIPRLRHDGESAGARVEVARVQGLGLGSKPESGK
jgi:hypothetical protein